MAAGGAVLLHFKQGAVFLVFEIRQLFSELVFMIPLACST